MTQLRKFTFVLLLAASFVHLSEQQCTKYYTVQSGDYCYKIWTDNGLTQQQFYSLNPGIDCNNLQIGQSVCVGGTVPPTQPPQATCGKYYTVVSGDTCYQIWTNNGLTEQQFYALNPGINCGDLKVGQVYASTSDGPQTLTISKKSIQPFFRSVNKFASQLVLALQLPLSLLEDLEPPFHLATLAQTALSAITPLGALAHSLPPRLNF
uniref:LysM domain-containing protein n=1 Tax=Acrobeloides nanus TaxID=290746 RepID=A0A914C4X0_9BILA